MAKEVDSRGRGSPLTKTKSFRGAMSNQEDKMYYGSGNKQSKPTFRMVNRSSVWQRANPKLYSTTSIPIPPKANLSVPATPNVSTPLQIVFLLVRSLFS